ncbi:hypothetical protein HNR46_001528 [Haloferula luteola]|uniref:DUF4139 domain-containing protein n=1 Tax=Haloferula luteola TaxID=595692 RepID=A0A840UZU7_9BACT|nr:hypothetical protein [Haloferula luteola]MBB5351292.1 hypothetical protein [Haloferula luteola]
MRASLLFTALITAASAETALTIYNRNLAVVRETLPLHLEAGENAITFDRATAQVQADSVVLRDPAGSHPFSLLEQSYRNDPVSRWLLLQQFEGQSIEFSHTYPDGRVDLIPGKIVRSGYVPGGSPTEPIIEVEGKLLFSLPGEPLFPNLGDGSILRPTLSWQISAPEAANFDAQLSYLTGGFTWEADYNLVAPEKGESVTLAGWITLSNHSGTGFDQAKVKLVAGDVNVMESDVRTLMRKNAIHPESAAAAQVQEKAFDDFHLYTLPRALTIRDKETKQVEFLRSPQVHATKKYIYDGASGFRYYGGIQTQPSQGQTFPKDVAIYWEFRNDEDNGLGVPLPAGRVRFYREDSSDGNLEFVGENQIDHTARHEQLSIYTGNAFDLVGERKIANFESNERQKWMRETVEVQLRNRSKEAKTIIVREHLWRGANWTIENPSLPFEKQDAQTIEFTVNLQPDEEKTLNYAAHYTW